MPQKTKFYRISQSWQGGHEYPGWLEDCLKAGCAAEISAEAAQHSGWGNGAAEVDETGTLVRWVSSNWDTSD